MNDRKDQQDLADAPGAVRAALLRAGQALTVKRGQMVLSTGATSDDVYAIIGGHLRVLLFPLNGREVIVRDLRAGALFGELAAIDRMPRSTTIIAIDKSTLAAIPAPVFRDIVTGTPEASLWFAGLLTRRIRELTDRVLELSAMSVRGRLHCQLLRMAAEAGVARNAAEITPAPTHDHLAALIGSQREAVSRELGYLAAIGMLHREGRTLVIRDVRALADLVRDLTGEASVPVDGAMAMAL